MARFERKLTGFQPARPTDYDLVERAIETAEGFESRR